MSFETWQAVGTMLAALFAGWQAHRSNKQTKSTGNGFAKHVLDGQARHDAALERIEGKIDRHVEDHAESDIRRKSA